MQLAGVRTAADLTDSAIPRFGSPTLRWYLVEEKTQLKHSMYADIRAPISRPVYPRVEGKTRQTRKTN